MNRIVSWIAALAALLLLAACGGASASAGGPQIVLETSALELGDVPNGEIVERVVTVVNDGDAPLVVDAVTTSCGCTTAALEPMTIAPGESGVLRVAFDSGAHGPDLRGPLMREVRLLSNDPATPEAVVALTANILPPGG
jgi:hypothetical protein